MSGRNEEIVARALKGMRDKVYVATKIRSRSRTKEEIVRDVETSLSALETDHIDIIQLHNVTGRERLFEPEMREALVKLKQQGKVRFFGVTTHTNETEVVNALVDDKDRFFDMVLVKYNFRSDDESEEGDRQGRAGGHRGHCHEDTGRRLHRPMRWARSAHTRQPSSGRSRTKTSPPPFPA